MIKKIFYSSLNQAAITFFPLLTLPIILRAISPNVYGQFIFYQSIIQYFIVFANLGFDFFAVREVASLSDAEYVNRVSQLFKLRLIAGLAMLFIYYIIVPFVFDDRLMYVLFSLLLISNLFNVNWLIIGMGQFKLLALRQVVGKTILLLLCFFFVHKTSDVYIYIVIQFLADFIPNFSVFLKFKKYIKSKRIRFSVLVKELSVIKNVFLAQVFIIFAANYDKTLLAYYAGTDQGLGFYAVAFNLFLVINSFITSTGPVFLSIYSGGGSSSKSRNKILYASLLISFVCIAAVLLVKNYFGYFVGEKYVASLPILLYLLIKLPFAVFSNWVINCFLLPQKNDKAYFTYLFIYFLFIVIASFVMISGYGVNGAIIASIASEVVLFATMVYYYFFKLNNNKDGLITA